MIQIDMEMPKNCDECNLFVGYSIGHKVVCRLTGNEYDWDSQFSDKRPPDCPLKEVKQGTWDIEISKDGYQATYRCSECGHQFKWLYDPHFPPVFNYCQKCGAYMREES